MTHFTAIIEKAAIQFPELSPACMHLSAEHAAARSATASGSDALPSLQTADFAAGLVAVVSLSSRRRFNDGVLCAKFYHNTAMLRPCRAAERWGSIQILKPAWLAASLDAGAPAPPEKYQLLPQPPRQPHGSDAGRLAPAKSAAVSRASGSLTAAAAAEGPAAMLPAPQPVAEAAAAGGGGVLQSAAAGGSANPFGSTIADTAPTDSDAAPPPWATLAAVPASAAAGAGGDSNNKLGSATASQQTSYSQLSQGVARPKGRGRLEESHIDMTQCGATSPLSVTSGGHCSESALDQTIMEYR